MCRGRRGALILLSVASPPVLPNSEHLYTHISDLFCSALLLSQTLLLDTDAHWLLLLLLVLQDMEATPSSTALTARPYWLLAG